MKPTSRLGSLLKIVTPQGLLGWKMGLVVDEDPVKGTINVRCFNHLDPRLDEVVVMPNQPVQWGGTIEGWGWLYHMDESGL